MRINLCMSIFKNPKFKAQFDEIKNVIDKDYEEYIESLPKKYFDESGEYVGSESFYLEFYEFYNEYGAKYSITKPDNGEITRYIVRFWEKISKEYFPEEIMLIDSPGIGCYYVYKGKQYNILEDIYGFITDMLSKYNKPFQF